MTKENQSVEQLIRNQQVVCSSHITSSIPTKSLISWGPLLFYILGRNESALRELGCAEIHGGLPPDRRSGLNKRYLVCPV